MPTYNQFNLYEHLLKIQTFSVKEKQLKVPSAKYRPFCPTLICLSVGVANIGDVVLSPRSKQRNHACEWLLQTTAEITSRPVVGATVTNFLHSAIFNSFSESSVNRYLTFIWMGFKGYNRYLICMMEEITPTPANTHTHANTHPVTICIIRIVIAPGVIKVRRSEVFIREICNTHKHSMETESPRVYMFHRSYLISLHMIIQGWF